MSRSYKHTPRAGDTKDKFFKKYANRKVRRLPTDEHPLKGKSYKKVFCQYDICDYETVGTSFEQYWERLVKISPFPIVPSFDETLPILLERSADCFIVANIILAKNLFIGFTL